MLVSTKSKQSSFGRRMWGGSNGTRSPGLPRGVVCSGTSWTALLQMVKVLFLQSIPLSKSGTWQQRSGIQNLTGSYLCMSGRLCRKRRHFNWWLHIFGWWLFPHYIGWSLETFSAWGYLILIPSLMKIISTTLKFYFLQVSNPIPIKIFSSSLLNSSQPTCYLLSLLTFNLPRTIPTDLNILAAGS